jgi:hypothetical protein
MHLSSQQAIAAAVALASFGVALNDGGYSIGFISGACFALWWVILLCIGLRVLPRGGATLESVAVGGCLAVLAAWTALSFTWASDDGAVFAEVVRVLSYLGLFVLVVIASGREGARPWIVGLTIGLSAVVLLALASRFEPSLSLGSATGSRLRYPLGYWNGLATCAALALTLLGWHTVEAKTRLVRSLSTALLPLPPLALYLSASRGGVIAAVIGLVLIFALAGQRPALLGSLALGAAGAMVLVLVARGQPDLLDGLEGHQATVQGNWLLGAAVLSGAVIGLLRHRLDATFARVSISPRARRGALAVAAVALLGFLAAENPVHGYKAFKEPPAPGAQLGLGGHLTNANSGGRYQFWGAAIDAVEDEPLHGIGAGQYESWWDQHGSIYWVLKDAHSLLFETAAELGIVGLLLVLGFLLLPAWFGWRGRAGPNRPEVGVLLAVLAAGTFSASIDWMWELPATFAPVVVAAALLTGGATAVASGRELFGESKRKRLALGVATLLVAWVALWCSGDLLATRTKLDESRSAAADGRLEAAVDAADDAITLQPWAAEPRLQLGLVEELGKDLGAARSSLREAADRAPDDWQIWYLVSRVAAKSGRLGEAHAALQRARELDPRSPFVQRRPPFLKPTGDSADR